MEKYNTSLAQKLSNTGLSSKEARIYAFLMEKGGAFPSRIASDTGINRTTTYKILETLAIRGLVTELEKKKKLFYQAESPKSLERFSNTQITIAKRQKENLEQLLPALEGLYSASPNKPIVKFFEGKEGVIDVYKSHVDVEKSYEMLSFSNTSDLMEFLPENFRNDYIKKKSQIGITTRAIFPDTKLDINYNETIYGKFPKNIWPKIKNIPRKIFPFKSDMTIYGGNKVSIINFNEPRFAGTIIEDQVVHNMMKMIFELSWNGIK